jgi:hypothetical protein
MSTITSYMDGKTLKYRVVIGRKVFKGFSTPDEALRRGIDAVREEDPRSIALLDGKSFERQVGIVFGAEAQVKYCGEPLPATPDRRVDRL